MKVLLINPPYSRLRRTKECTEMVTPLGLSCVGAYLAGRGFDVAVYDANYNSLERLPRFNDLSKLLAKFELYSENLKTRDNPVRDEIRDRIEREKPDVVGVTVSSPIRGAAFVVAEVCKEVDARIKVVFGGYHPTSCPEDALSNVCVDAVVRGEGEATFAELVARFSDGGLPVGVQGVSYRENGATVHNMDRPLIENLDELPFSAGFLRGAVTGKVPVQYARGCPYNCKFCADRLMWHGRVRYRSAERLVDEMEAIVKETGIREFTFVDGTFNLSREKVVEFCEVVIRRKLRVLWDALVRADRLDDEMLSLCRKAGCAQMNVGVESGSPRVLEDIGKKTDLAAVAENVGKIRRHGIAAVSFFCVGMPPEKPEDLRATEYLVDTLPHDFVIINLFTPFPGTVYFEELKSLGLVTSEHDFDMYGYKAPDNHFTIDTPREEYFSCRDEILRAANKANRKGKLAAKLLFYNLGFYLRHPRQLLRRAFRLMGF
jgi:anaerobic magnesium-protoporphyrin IX monomethyl ester cyclase